MIKKNGPHYRETVCGYLTKSLYTSIILLYCLSCTPPREFLLKKRGAIADRGPFIRVLIKKTNDRVLLSSKKNIRITDLKTRKIKFDGKARHLYFYAEKISGPILVESPGSHLEIDKKAYRGMVELHNNLGNLYVINIVKMNEYLYGVVPSEIPSSWEIEAVKAQAVAARTYTYHHLMNKKKSLYDLDATTNFQVYRGLAVETENSNKAVEETAGDIIVYNNKPILAFFHSTCGGWTMNDSNIWNGDDKPYLEPVRCGYCEGSPNYKWEAEINLYEIRHHLNIKYKGTGRILGISFKRRGTRVDSIIIQHKNGLLNLSGNEFRLLFPEKKIKSMYFSSEKTPRGLILHGYGWGHGVGMCQWGAKGMAEKGAAYKEILEYYYRGTRIINTGRKSYASR